jgi:hypothetical protein
MNGRTESGKESAKGRGTATGMTGTAKREAAHEAAAAPKEVIGLGSEVLQLLHRQRKGIINRGLVGRAVERRS